MDDIQGWLPRLIHDTTMKTFFVALLMSSDLAAGGLETVAVSGGDDESKMRHNCAIMVTTMATKCCYFKLGKPQCKLRDRGSILTDMGLKDEE